MKRVPSRQLLSQIDVLSASLGRIGEASVFMRRFRIALTNGAAPKTGKTPRVDRRRNASASTALSAKAEKSTGVARLKTELRVVPGVGPINERLLCDKGIVNVASLRSVFHDQFDEEDARFVEYLHQEVGIRHRHHCRSIAGYLKELPERGQPTDGQKSKRITLSIEGNISAGKTTFLQMVQESQQETDDWLDVVPEPIQEWQKVGGCPDNNLLERFYRDPKRHAYEFQNYVFLTRLDINRKTFDGPKPLRLMERSVFSDRLVFVRAVHEEKWMDDFQLELYDSWFNPMIREVPGLVPDGFIYLRAEPDTCMKRLRRRNRSEEIHMPNEYLEGLHEKHEEWFKQPPPPLPPTLYPTEALLYPTRRTKLLTGPHTEAKIAAMPEVITVPDELKGSIVWLGENGILSNDPKYERAAFSKCCISHDVKTAMAQIPALVLDCNDDIDIENNVEAKKEYVQKVKKYYEFVKHYAKSQQRFRPFWNQPVGERLRQRWHLVNSMSDEEVRKLCEEQLMHQMRGRPNSLKELQLPA